MQHKTVFPERRAENEVSSAIVPAFYWHHFLDGVLGFVQGVGGAQTEHSSLPELRRPEVRIQSEVAGISMARFCKWAVQRMSSRPLPRNPLDSLAEE